MNDEFIDRILDMEDSKRISKLNKMKGRTCALKGSQSDPSCRIRISRLSRQEALEFLRKNDIRTICQLRVKRKPSDMNETHYKEMFGSWSNAVNEAFMDSIPNQTDDSEYILNTVVSLGLFTFNKYICARKSNPKIVPPISKLNRCFGSFTNLKKLIVRKSMKFFIMKYSSLYKHLGRPPSVSECNEKGLPVNFALKYFGSKELMDEALFGISVYRKKRKKRKYRAKKEIV